ncbi:STE/STE11/cdc15 protein kinase [Rhodotorula toruloides]|uniref:Small ribosomal subunit protein bS18m n=1 Tax=Rhodotorula toruloides TaxID=5286 RepID=A0A511K760_RHOTO|nr:STE/STE11/cdc15 protein kinase [Rhodotorula toruloides]
MLRQARTLLQRVPSTLPAPPACAACRTFTTSTSLAAPGSSSPPTSGEGAQKPRNTTSGLLQLLEEVDQNDAALPAENNVSVLRHIAPNAIISPLQLSPRRLLVPYLPRPDFSLAYPLGPPRKFAMTHDPFLRYDIDALEDADLNPAILAEYVTTMGMIKPRGKTGLQKRSQKRMSRAIKRARSMGLIPYFGVSIPGHY